MMKTLNRVGRKLLRFPPTRSPHKPHAFSIVSQVRKGLSLITPYNPQPSTCIVHQALQDNPPNQALSPAQRHWRDLQARWR